MRKRFWKIKATDLATNSEIVVARLPKTLRNLLHSNVIGGSTLIMNRRRPSRTKSGDRLKAAKKDAVDKRATTHFDNRTSIHILRLHFNRFLERWEFDV